MKDNTSLAIFETHKIRRYYDEKKEIWYFSVVDVVRVLTDSIDARKYWNKLAQRLRNEGSEVVTKCHQLKFMASDGKFYLTDGADTETVLRLIQATKNIREKAIICLLAYSGIRNKELCSLKVCDVDFATSQIRILGGKFNKDRIGYVTGECLQVLAEYLKAFPRPLTEFLFTTLVKNNKYGGSDLRKLCNQLARRADLKKKVFPHLFRHSLATNLLNRGANIITVQNILGHSFIDSTMVYVKSFPQRIKAEYCNFISNYI